MYYTIDEAMARRANNAYSFSDYRDGSATAEYRQMVDEAASLAERCKQGRGEAAAAKIDALLDRYARRLADNINARNRNTASCPSVMIAGPANFPTRKKDRQNAREDSLMREYQEIQHILHQIRITGTGGIQSGDPEAVRQLEEKLARLEKDHSAMKAANAYYRKHKTLDGCPGISQATREWLTRPGVFAKGDGSPLALYGCPYPAYALQNSNANIKRIRQRIASLQAIKASPTQEERHNGCTYLENSDIMRVQLVFDSKPSENTRALLKANGFHWSPSQSAWQRQLTENGKAAARRVLESMA